MAKNQSNSINQRIRQEKLDQLSQGDKVEITSGTLRGKVGVVTEFSMYKKGIRDCCWIKIEGFSAMPFSIDEIKSINI